MQPALLLTAQSSSLGDTLFVLVSFIILVLLVKHFAWGPITKMMNQRADKITGDLDYADQERKKASDLKQKREEALNNSQAEAVQIVANAKEAGNQQRDSIVSKAHDQAQDIQKKAREDAKQAKADAMKSVQNDVAELSLNIASKVIGRELSSEDQKDLIDSYIKELKSSHEAE
ncbi:F0F1 ATP synthase subunit B [Bombilactobacillus thymidiniphilus]|uniref:ATP synthase subunit b n=1 Tax=Bombilactobacillus thymidiniphilus TaxID=2923363 RepID=A0ABY4PDZ1_9LACO|nr:F0F1 ATP synthase subunit B [Bombilactobacillus thymidiniphilus]UQS83845.1 F0F1 ATP synthase subunit B [Bombilactobacillus thymidiniphilus]